MAKFRKKPVVIEASQWFKHGDHPAVTNGRGPQQWPEGSIKNGAGEVCGYIETLEGGHIVTPGDWIIRGVKGELYPCKPDIFEATYERVEDDADNKHIERRCLDIADATVPQYRSRAYGCSGTYAKMWQSAYDRALRALTAAEQAEPAPVLITDRRIRTALFQFYDVMGGLGISRYDRMKEALAAAMEAEPYSKRPTDYKTDHQVIVEPAPAARSGAVKVDVYDILLPLEDIHSDGGQCEWHDVANAIDEVRRRILAALEPADPATDAEPELWRYKDTPDGAWHYVEGYEPVRREFRERLFTHPPESRLREAAQSVIDRMFSTYKARNGREVGIEADDGEKCWIVHSDDIEQLRAALAQGADDGRS